MSVMRYAVKQKSPLGYPKGLKWRGSTPVEWALRYRRARWLRLQVYT